jgi:hypothetical protein
MSQHVYILIEALSMTAGQRNTLVAALRALGPSSAAQPAHLNHSRLRLDNLAVILEALFADNDVTVANVKQFLANAFSVDVATITHSVTTTAYGVQATYARTGVDRLRFTLLGGADPTWAQSRAAASQYISDNAVAWGDA